MIVDHFAVVVFTDYSLLSRLQLNLLQLFLQLAKCLQLLWFDSCSLLLMPSSFAVVAAGRLFLVVVYAAAVFAIAVYAAKTAVVTEVILMLLMQYWLIQILKWGASSKNLFLCKICTLRLSLIKLP